MGLIRAAFIMLATTLAAPPGQAGTLEDIHARGIVNCAVAASAPGLSEMQDGKRSGLAIDFCALIAAAVVGRAEAVAIIEVGAEDGAIALQAGEADILLAPRPWKLGPEVRDGVFLVEPLLTRSRDGAVFGPQVRQGDDSWFVAVRWVLALARASSAPGDEAADAFAELGLQSSARQKITSFSGSYQELLERHMKAFTDDGWQAVTPPPGMQF
ncbi:MAG: hypothetical protein IPM06_00150 [Rhizobiales bacterium]|nr:hypothetical protein [Hyphomicrobiales bacterium]